MSFNQGQGLQNTLHTAQGLLGQGQQNVQPTQGSGLQGFVSSAQGLMGHEQNAQFGQVQPQGNLMNTAQGILGSGHTGQSTQETGFQGALSTAQGLMGHGQNVQLGQGQPQNSSSINTRIDQAQSLLGHTDQGGSGIQGTIDKMQGQMGHGQNAQFGQVQPQGNLMNTAQGILGSGHTGQSTQETGFQGSMSTAQGLMGHGQNTQLGQGQTQSSLSGINTRIDQAQSLLGHTGQGGSGIHGMIDKMQGQTGPTGTMGSQDQGFVSTAQGLIGNRQNLSTDQNVNRGGNVSNTMGRGQESLGNTRPGGSVINKIVDKVRGVVGHNDQAGLH